MNPGLGADGSFVASQPFFRLPVTAIAEDLWPKGRQTKPCTADVALDVMTYNCLSIKASGALKSLSVQLAARNILIAGLQETCRRPPPRCQEPFIKRKVGEYMMFAAHASPAGKGGTAIFINSVIAVASSRSRWRSKQYFFNTAAAAVLHAEPRLLIVAATAGPLDFLLVSGHVPDSDRREQQSWLRHTKGEIEKRAAKRHVVIMIDSNITCMPVRQAAGEDAKRTSLPANAANTKSFEQFADDLGLTFAGACPQHWQAASQRASFVARGANTLNDYIVFSQSLSCESGSLHVHSDFDTTSAADDHLPVSCRLGGSVCTSAPRKGFKPGYDRKAAAAVDAGRTLEPLLQLCPQIPWSIEPTSHAAILNAFVRQALAIAFPPPSTHPRQRHVTPELFADIQARGKLKCARRSATRALRRAIDECTIFIAFAVWNLAGHLPDGNNAEGLSGLIFSGDGWRNRVDAVHHCQLRQRVAHASVQAATALLRPKMDEAVAIQAAALSHQLGDAAEEGNRDLVFRLLKPLYRRKTPKPLQLLRPDGTRTANECDAVDFFTHVHAQQVDGRPVCPIELARKHLVPDRIYEDLPFDPELFASRAELGMLFRSFKPFVGLGPDAVGSEVPRASPAWFAAQHWALQNKAAFTIRPPLQYRGGALFALFKGKGSHEDAGAYRDITCCAAQAKAIGRPLRATLMTCLAAACPGTNLSSQHPSGLQFGGGLSGGSTEFAHLAARAVGDFASARATSASITYLDLSQAFASIHRWLATPPPCSAEEVAYRLARTGRSPAEISEFVSAIQALDVWHSFAVASRGRERTHLQAFLVASLHCSWFRMQASDVFIATGSGTPAGSALGDALFLLAFSGVMRCLCAELDAEGLSLVVHLHEPLELDAEHEQQARFEPALYMDDVEIPTFAPAGSIEENSSKVATVAKHALQRHWLVMNTAPGKT